MTAYDKGESKQISPGSSAGGGRGRGEGAARGGTGPVDSRIFHSPRLRRLQTAKSIVVPENELCLVHVHVNS
ncbi:hypothetical protein CDAR_497271 [Caerostris darwini]|uniref:Uncharacterized protein n=1 Tax=Caerostris darwini TaxID=1538125 RepID=A0AAV4S3P4_9ARAC|nr:hypothetical protein CDAR_497271 [Caerostris darwini]